MDEPRKRIAGLISGLDIRYDVGEGHPLLGRRMPDLELATDDGAEHRQPRASLPRAVVLNHIRLRAAIRVGGACAPPTRIRAVHACQYTGCAERTRLIAVYQGGAPGDGLRTSVAVDVAVVLVHPVPFVGILALVTVSVFVPLYLPVTFTAPLGATVIVQADRILDLNVAPSFGTLRVSVVFAIVAVQVPEVLMVSVPPDESVHPLMVGGAESGIVSDALLATLPLTVNVVQETVIGTESMSPLNVARVPVFSLPVTVVPAFKVA
jgi:hypothetical protein